MKTFSMIAAQGEITLRRLDEQGVPAGFTAMTPENGIYVIGHSETGHHHVMAAGPVTSVAVMDRPPEGMRILRMIVESETPLIHLRNHDTHEPLMVPPGAYEVRIGREYDPFAEIARTQID